MSAAVLLDRRTGRPVVDRALREKLEGRGALRLADLIERGALRPDVVAAERNPPLYMDVSNAYSGDELGLPWRDVISEGVLFVNDLVVTGQAGANSINVAAGACWILGDFSAGFQPNYRCSNDAPVNLGISPDPAQPRRVRVVASITDQSFAGVGRLWALQALHGTPAASPALPAEPASAISLTDITVPAGAVNSAAYTFADLRPRATVGNGQALGGGGLWSNYVPVWSATGTTPALGAGGTITGKYVQIGKTVVGRIVVVMGGAGFNAGTGIYIFTLPVPVHANDTGELGFAHARDTSAVTDYVGGSVISDATHLSIETFAAPTANWTNLVPFTWATGDTLSIKFSYEAA